MLVFLVEGGATGEPKHAHPLALKDWLLKVYLRLLHLNKTMTIYLAIRVVSSIYQFTENLVMIVRQHVESCVSKI